MCNCTFPEASVRVFIPSMVTPQPPNMRSALMSQMPNRTLPNTEASRFSGTAMSRLSTRTVSSGKQFRHRTETFTLLPRKR